MTPTELRAKLMGVTRTQIVTLEYMSPVRGKPIVKYQRVQAIINFRYDKLMARELGQADFTVGQRSWGQHVENSPLVENKGNYYLEGLQHRVLEVAYYDTDGLPVQHQEKERLDVVLPVRDYDLAKIQTLSIDGERYDLSVPR